MKISEQGLIVEKDYYVDKCDCEIWVKCQELFDEDLIYDVNKFDCDVVVFDQICIVIKVFKDVFFIQFFFGCEWVFKMFIFVKDDFYVDDIVQIVCDEFVKGNEFCQKIIYKIIGVKFEDLIVVFCNLFMFCIVVIVDMIVIGMDIKLFEVVFFMCLVKSCIFFE